MKLYWRVKINGKWTWRPAHAVKAGDNTFTVHLEHFEEGE